MNFSVYLVVKENCCSEIFSNLMFHRNAKNFLNVEGVWSSQSKERCLWALSTCPYKQGTPSDLSVIRYGSVTTADKLHRPLVLFSLTCRIKLMSMFRRFISVWYSTDSSFCLKKPKYFQGGYVINYFIHSLLLTEIQPNNTIITSTILYYCICLQRHLEVEDP